MKLENIEILKNLVRKKENLETAISVHKHLIEKNMPVFMSSDYGTHTYYMLRNWNRNTETLIGEEQEILFAKKVFEMAIKELEIELTAVLERIKNLD